MFHRKLQGQPLLLVPCCQQTLYDRICLLPLPIDRLFDEIVTLLRRLCELKKSRLELQKILSHCDMPSPRCEMQSCVAILVYSFQSRLVLMKQMYIIDAAVPGSIMQGNIMGLSISQSISGRIRSSI